ncbi:hypothetical protein crov263 [Cafeteria roenbergensis virus]|uniref:DUF5672 domain-containing protein n=1 Tax=Cafeteria roenbergensis virus (strain BV-PW1) TaxID=693272 RepID=E3T533_CROVB|nr:hypothetical protein crov263 [Cafeteria roenbergensis virus BV-PW1]ADO67296.1 hypothetical protein crov263 [Cafeteria roenbergensis virus BV-PW1]
MKHKLIGILVEPRRIKQIFYNIENFFEILPNTILYFYCGKNLKFYFNSLLLKYKNLRINELNVSNLDSNSYSDLFKSIHFWKQFNAEYALTIQTDGCLCKNSKFKIENFYNYDYVGGYAYQNWWRKEVGNLCNTNVTMCFNGGFSLRNIDKCIQVINAYKPLPTKKYYRSIKFEEYAEDLYFVYGMLKLGFKVGDDKFATNFCTHTKYINNTFCVHKLFHYQKNINNFIKYCPEFIKFIKLDELEEL